MPWVTMNGRHVLIGEDGKPVNGPAGVGGAAGGHTQDSWEKAVRGNDGHFMAIDRWTKQGYRDIRDVERGSVPSEADAKALTENFHAAIDAAPNYSGEVYRGIDQSRDRAFMAGLQTPGSVVTMKSTSSATKEWAVAHDFAESTTSGEKEVAGRVVMVIQAKTEVDISSLSAMPREKEVLLRRGSSYKVISSAMDHGRLIVHLHEV